MPCQRDQDDAVVEALRRLTLVHTVALRRTLTLQYPTHFLVVPTFSDSCLTSISHLRCSYEKFRKKIFERKQTRLLGCSANVALCWRCIDRARTAKTPKRMHEAWRKSSKSRLIFSGCLLVLKLIPGWPSSAWKTTCLFLT